MIVEMITTSATRAVQNFQTVADARRSNKPAEMVVLKASALWSGNMVTTTLLATKSTPNKQAYTEKNSFQSSRVRQRIAKD